MLLVVLTRLPLNSETYVKLLLRAERRWHAMTTSLDINHQGDPSPASGSAGGASLSEAVSVLLDMRRTAYTAAKVGRGDETPTDPPPHPSDFASSFEDFQPDQTGVASRDFLGPVRNNTNHHTQFDRRARSPDPGYVPAAAATSFQGIGDGLVAGGDAQTGNGQAQVQGQTQGWFSRSASQPANVDMNSWFDSLDIFALGGGGVGDF